MAEAPRDPEKGDDTNRGATTGTPRWVKVFGVAALVVVLLFLILLLIGGHNGRGRHTGGDSGHTALVQHP